MSVEELEKLYQHLNVGEVPLLIADKAIRKTKLDHPDYEFDYSIARSIVKRALGEIKNIIQEQIKHAKNNKITKN